MIAFKIIMFFILIVAIGTVSAGSLMPEVTWFNFQNVEVLDGKAEIQLVGWDFVCFCTDMQGNTALCTPADFGTVSNPGPYFESADMCDFIPPP